jgi:hypothetical protein
MIASPVPPILPMIPPTSSAGAAAGRPRRAMPPVNGAMIAANGRHMAAGIAFSVPIATPIIPFAGTSIRCPAPAALTGLVKSP